MIERDTRYGRSTIYTSDYISVILRAIEKAENDPVHLRSLVYDLSRLSLGKHLLNNYRLLGSEGLQRHVQDLETAINHIEDLRRNSSPMVTRFRSSNPRLVRQIRPPLQFEIRLAIRSSMIPGWTMRRWCCAKDPTTSFAIRGASHKYCDRRKYGSQAHTVRNRAVRGPTSGGAFNWLARRLSGSGIYAVMLMRSDLFFAGFNNYSQAAPVSQGMAVASIEPNRSGLGAPGAVHSSAGRSLRISFA